jgi:hypothetical protein
MAVEQLDFVLRHLRHLAGARDFDQAQTSLTRAPI